TETQPEIVPMRVTVAEGNHQRVNFGVGYGTEEKARVDAEYHHVNFLGGARSAGAHVRYSSLDRGVRLDFQPPYLFPPHLSLGSEGQQWLTFTPAYRSTVSGAKLTLTHRADAGTSWSTFVMSEHDSSVIDDSVRNNPTQRNSLIALGLDPTTDSQSGTLNAIGFDFQNSTADNLLNAHRGIQFAFHAEQAGRVVAGTFNYWAISADGRHYAPFGERLVLASRLQVGNIHPYGHEQSNMPFSKRFFRGGATSIL